jgi:hypothetical protein
MVFDANWEYIDVCSFYNQNVEGLQHSGDVRMWRGCNILGMSDLPRIQVRREDGMEEEGGRRREEEEEEGGGRRGGRRKGRGRRL